MTNIKETKDFGTAEYWEDRRIDDKVKDWRNQENLNWVEEYWKSAEHPHRKLIIEELKKLYPFPIFNPFESLLEVGCNCGPNISLITKEFPELKITGVDINQPAIIEGLKRFPDSNRLNSKIWLQKQNLKELNFPPKSFDIILSDAVLMYIEPEEIRPVVEKMIKITKKAIILCEWQIPSDRLGQKVYGHWARDYQALLKDYSIKSNVYKLTSIDWPSENWSRVGYVITAKSIRKLQNRKRNKNRCFLRYRRTNRKKLHNTDNGFYSAIDDD